MIKYFKNMSEKIKIQKNVCLADYCTFKIGGNAKYFIEISNKEDLVEAFEWVLRENVKYEILAGGSNMLISDNGFDGAVIFINNRDFKIYNDRIEAGAGLNLAKVLTLAMSNSFSGIEWSVGIPGSIGGAVRGNAGAFGSSISENVETLEVFDIDKKSFSTWSRNDCGFVYRSSKFAGTKNFLIWRAILRFQKEKSGNIEDKVFEFNNHRAKSQPKLPSAGCVFKNVIFSDLDLENNKILAKIDIKNQVRNDKVAAGWIIDRAGLKGKRIGGAKVSLEHANFIVNTGKATADDVAMLISFIKQQVREKFSIQLTEEIYYFGF